MNATILGLGAAVPAHTITQHQALELARVYCGEGHNPRALDVLYRGTRIKTRYSVVTESAGEGRVPFFPPPITVEDRGPGTAQRMQRYEQEVVPMALRACREAFADSRVDAGAITHVIVVTCTGFFAPGLDIALIQSLNLRPNVQRLQVGFMGCHGALNGLQAARDILNANSDACVLLCAAELCSLHMQYGHQDGSAVANALFADGAAAAILGRGSDSASTLGGIAAVGSLVVPESRDAMSWRIGDHGFEMTLSSRIPDLIERHVPQWMDNWLGSAGLKVGEIAAWAVHPGGPRILDAVEKSLNLPCPMLKVSREILGDHGNMSSPTVLFILDRLRQTAGKMPLPCVMLGFGPGLTIEAVLLR